MMEIDQKWMQEALAEARLAFDAGEIPVGAVVVRNGEIVARAHNRCEQYHDATAHAEMLAIREASRKASGWRLSDATLYVTLEPCPMCMGAAINARIGRIVFASKDARAGACGSLLDLSAYPLEVRPACESGVLENEAQTLLRDFFLKLREKNKPL
jgi:tRNA(adenine34) deaminase